MRNRFFALVIAPIVAIAVVSLAPPSVAGQGSTTARKKKSAPAARKTAAKPGSSLRTPWGDPDLQGVWDYRTITPLERAFGDKEVLTDEEVAELEQQKAAFEAADPKDTKDPAGAAATGGRFSTYGTSLNDPVGAYGRVWYDTGTKVVPSKRTSLIVDPPDGRIPYTPEGRQRMHRQDGAANGPEDLSLGTRCILGLNAGPPMRPHAYNNNAQIFQAPGYVAILNEMIHDVRIIPLDGRPPVGPNIRQWRGDSRGHWEGQTLVVETANYSDKTQGGSWAAGGAYSAAMRLVERFTRVDADTLGYQFTVDDPTAYTKPWTAAFSMTKTDDRIYEYACHEGNYGMFGILSGARAKEKAADEAARKK